MSVEEILEAEYGKGMVIIDYSKKSVDNRKCKLLRRFRGLHFLL